MKKKFNYMAKYGTAFFLSLLIFCMFVPKFVAADTEDVLRWSTVDLPGITGNIIVTPSEVSRIAVSAGDIIFALDTPNSKVYRSKNGGSTWDDITNNVLSSGALPQFTNIAVAPLKPQVVALVTSDGTKVFLSTDGGDNWINTNVPPLGGTTIQCITISAGGYLNNSSVWDMAIGTAKWGDALTTGQVWCTRIGAVVSGWQPQDITVDSPGAKVSAIAFSPSYWLHGDGAILAVASTAGGVGAKTVLCMGQRDFIEQTTTWNTIINPPVVIDTRGDVPPGDKIISSIALPADFYGDNSSNSIAFLSYNRREAGQQDANNVYRYDNTNGLVKLINTATDISSIALYGTIKTGTSGVATGKLLAGDYYPDPDPTKPFVQVRRCLNPFDPPSVPGQSPVSWQIATQPPTGPGSAQVAWSSSGTEAYCGTSRIPEYTPPVPEPPPFPDESAFSRSLDNGDNWAQVSLIDTAIRICDIAPAPDSKSLFMATYNPIGLEWVWRSAGEPLGDYWGRVFALDTGSDRIILRFSPDYDADGTMYAIEVGELPPPLPPNPPPRYIGVTHTRGNYWLKRYVPSDVIDAVVVDSKTLYVALPNGIIRKTSNEGAIWQNPVHTGLLEINMLSLTENEHLLVGSRNGTVAYSTNNGTKFIEIPKAVSNTASVSDVQVIADSHYTQNNTIYAATTIADKGIWRWTIGSSITWEQVDKTITDLGSGEQFSGLAVGEEGTLYALRMEASSPNTGGMNRSLNPADPKAIKIEWDVVNQTLPVGVIFDPMSPLPLPLQPPLTLFSHMMPFLKLSGNFIQNDLWSFSTDDLNNPIIYRFQDNLCKVGAWINPAGQIGCDPASGRNQGFDLIWEQLSLSDRYQFQITKDSNFTLPVFDSGDTYPFLLPVVVTSPALVYFAGGGGTSPALDPKIQVPSLECGHAYFWRVRTRHATTGEFIRSPWSKTGDLIIKAGFRVTTPYLGPQLLAPDNGCGCSCSAPVCFSWTPFKQTTAYWFDLSENSDMSDPIVSTYVGDTTAYMYDGKLKCNTNYFWRVMAIEPAPSDWSAVFSFVTKSNAQPTQTTSLVPLSLTPLWIWGILATGTILAICLLMLIIRRS